MDNRNRDKMDKDSISSPSSGNVNKNVSRDKSDTSQFGKKIEKSEELGGLPGRSGGSSGSSSTGSE